MSAELVVLGGGSVLVIDGSRSPGRGEQSVFIGW